MLNRMVKESLAKKMILEQSSEGGEGVSLANIWRKGVLGREQTMQRSGKSCSYR